MRSPRPPVASSRQRALGPGGDFHNRAAGNASSHLLSSVNKPQSRLHFPRLPFGVPFIKELALRAERSSPGPPSLATTIPGTAVLWGKGNPAFTQIRAPGAVYVALSYSARPLGYKGIARAAAVPWERPLRWARLPVKSRFPGPVCPTSPLKPSRPPNPTPAPLKRAVNSGAPQTRPGTLEASPNPNGNRRAPLHTPLNSTRYPGSPSIQSEAPLPASVPPRPHPAPGTIVASTKGRTSRSPDFRGAPRPAPCGPARRRFWKLRAGAGRLPLAAAASAAVQAKERHGAGGVDGGAGFIPFLLSGEAVAVEDPLQGGFHHPAAGVRNQQNLRCASPRRRRCSPFAKWRRRRRPPL